MYRGLMPSPVAPGLKVSTSGLEIRYGFRQGHVEVIVCCLNEIIIILKYCIGNDVAICL